MLSLLLLLHMGGIFFTQSILQESHSVKSEITANDSLVWTETIESFYQSSIPIREKRYRFSVEESGIYHIRLTSNYFDAYLVLWDSQGCSIAEDDDGWISSEAQLVVELSRGESFSISACALHGGVGQFELSLQKGTPAVLSITEKADRIGGSWLAISRLRLEGSRLLSQGKVDEALAKFETSLSRSQESLSDAQETATAHFALGGCLAKAGKLAASRESLENAIEIQSKLLGPDDIQTCMSYEALGETFFRLGDYSSSRECFEKALHGYRTNLAEREMMPLYWILQRCAVNAYWLAEWETCELYFRKCIELGERLFGKNSWSAAYDYSMLGFSRFIQGDWSEARAAYEHALAIQKQIHEPDSHWSDEIRGRMATIEMAEGNIDQAQNLLEQALRSAFLRGESGNSSAANTLSRLAYLQLAKKNFTEARHLFEQAVALFKRAHGASDHYCVVGLSDVALAHKDFREARRLLEVGEKYYEEKADTFAQFRIQWNLGKLHFLEGSFASAQKHLERAVAISTKAWPGNHFHLALAYHDLTCLFIEWDKLDIAWSYARRAYEAVDQNFQNILSTMPEEDRHQYIATQRLVLESVLFLASQRNDWESKIFTFTVVSKWKGRVFRGMLSAKQAIFKNYQESPIAILDRLQKIQSRISAITSLRDSMDTLPTAQKLGELSKEKAEIEKELAKLPGRGTWESSSDWTTVQKLMPKGSSFICFLEHRPYIPTVRTNGQATAEHSWGPPQISAWILSPEKNEGTPTQILLGPSAEIASLLKTFLAELVAQRHKPHMQSSIELTRLHRRVYEEIWQPIKQAILGKVVFISADSCIGTLPFGVIQQPNGRYLIEDFRFTYSQEIGDLIVRPRPQKEENFSLIAVGGVDFGTTPADQSSNYWKPLTSTIKETTAIIDLHEQTFTNATRLHLHRSAPTESLLKKELPNHSFLHIATHGFFNPNGLDYFWEKVLQSATTQSSNDFIRGFQPRFSGNYPGLLSGIVCAGANQTNRTEIDDNLLTAEEVSWLDLSKCNLVVLSACETGLGTVRGGEGIVGLRSAFRQAGAKSVISSLWSVGDQSTKGLMEDFYHALWINRSSKLDALREAQLKCLTSQKTIYGYSVPYYWGAFILDGDWN